MKEEKKTSSSKHLDLNKYTDKFYLCARTE